ncbi:MAG TPA: hypothetical protein VKW08_14520 [Xanthobacteraceae bacterium]|nr:hypothetical protein [Xanthobacteraceae bacterium]
MPNPFDGNDGSWPSLWPQYAPSNLPFNGPSVPSSFYDDWTTGSPAVQAAYDFWFGAGKSGTAANAAPDASAVSSAAANPAPSLSTIPSTGAPVFPSWADPYLKAPSSNFPPSAIASSPAANWGAFAPTPPLISDVTKQYLLPLSPLRLPYSAAAGGIWEGLAKELEQKERANGLPTDGFLGSFAYLPTSSDTDASPSHQPQSFPSGPADVPLSASTLNNNFLPNGLPRFTGGPPDYLSAPPAAAPSDPADSAPANQSILFRHPRSSFDLGGIGATSNGPDTRELAEPGLPLTKSGEPYFPPTSPLLGTQGQAQYAARGGAQLLAPLTYDTLTWAPPSVTAVNAAGKLPSQPPLGLAAAIDAASIFFPEGRVARAAEFGLGAGERAFPELITGPYGELKGTLPPGWQANHINQSAAFKKLVPHDEGFSVAMRGDVITEPGTPHHIFHRFLEDFWDQFREEVGSRYGEKPTINEYHQAAKQALITSGFTPEQASYLVEQAANQLTSKGVSLSDKVPEIPIAIWRRRKM